MRHVPNQPRAGRHRREGDGVRREPRPRHADTDAPEDAERHERGHQHLDRGHPAKEARQIIAGLRDGLRRRLRAGDDEPADRGGGEDENEQRARRSGREPLDVRAKSGRCGRDDGGHGGVRTSCHRRCAVSRVGHEGGVA